MTKPVKEGLDKIIDEIAELLGTGGNVQEPIQLIRKTSRKKYTEGYIVARYLNHEPTPKALLDYAVRTRDEIKEEYTPKEKKQKSYSIEKGTVPKFAFFEIVNELLRREEYTTVESIDEAIGNTDASVLRHYYGDLQCEEDNYYRLVGLVTGKKLDAEQTEKLKSKNTGVPEEYNLTGKYDIGQIVSFPFGIGVILMKREHNKIIAAMEDKTLMTYLEKGEEHSEIFRRRNALETTPTEGYGKGGYQPR